MKTLAILGVWLAGLALCLAPPTYGPFPTGTGGGLSSNEVYQIALSVGGPTNGISASTATNIVNNNNAATATTASNVAAAVTNDWRNYTLAASNSLYSTIVTQECVEVFTSDTNRIYATLAGTAAANGTYHWNASLVSYTNTTGCGIYTDDIDFFITNASSLYVGVGNNFDVTWDVDTGGSPPPVTRFGTNSTVYCADIPAAFQSISFNSNALYLSVGGNDLFAVRGNPIRPWKTFSACLTNAVQGDVVFVGPGTFTNHLGSGATTRASIIGSGKTTTTIHGPILTVGGSNIMFKDFTYDAYTLFQGYLRVSGTNILFDNLKILGQQDGIFMQGWDNFKGANLSIESEWDCIADYQWATAQRSNAVAQFYNCDLFSRDIGNSFPPTCVSVGSSQLKFFGGSMVASNGGAGFTSCLFAQAGGSAAAHLGRITLANVSLLAASTNGAAYSLRWATNGQIFTAGMSISPDRISGSPLITSLDSGANLFPGIIISTNTGSSINSVGLTNGNVTIPGTLSVTGTTTAGTLYSPSISGDGLGITNAVDLIAGDSSITIVTNANKRSFTLTSTASGGGGWTGNPAQFSIVNGQTNILDGGYVSNLVNWVDGFNSNRTLIVDKDQEGLTYLSYDLDNSTLLFGRPPIANGQWITNINATNIVGNLNGSNIVGNLNITTQIVTQAIIGNGVGISNAVDLIAGDSSVTIVTNAYKRSFTLTAAAAGESALSTNMMMFPFEFPPTTPSSTATPITNATYVMAKRFDRPFRVNSFTRRVGTAVTGGFVGYGIYSFDGNTKLFDTGPLSQTTGGILTAAVTSPGVLPAGMYYIAWTGDSSATVSSFTMQSLFSDIFNGAGALTGTAANTSTAGQLPTTLGTITASTGSSPANVPCLLIK